MRWGRLKIPALEDQAKETRLAYADSGSHGGGWSRRVNERMVGYIRQLVHRCLTSEVQIGSWQDLVGTGLHCPAP